MDDDNKQIEITGKVVTGSGEGKYYIGIEGYKKQFIEKLGIDPAYGTLNLKLDDKNLKKLDEIKKSTNMILVNGFKQGDKQFGDVLCFVAETRGIRCALILPVLSRHKDVAELISSEELRVSLRLKDGTALKVSVSV